MRSVIIDDEPLILERFTRLLSKIEDIEIVRTYTNANEAIATINQDKPDVVFLDIEMPGLNGIDVAEILKEKTPHIHIVFVTAHRDYASQAFDLNAIDYLTRPVQLQRLKETVNRINLKQGKSNKHNDQMLCCFGSLQFKRSHKRHFLDVYWRTKKAQELFAYLVFNSDKKVRKDSLVDMLWPHTGWSQGFSQLYSAMYQVRKTLEKLAFNISIKNSENFYTLALNDVKVDVHEWENKLASLEPITQHTISDHITVLKLYKGDYLHEYNYSWAEGEKERLRTIWLNHVQQVTEYLIDHDKYMQAINIYHDVQQIYPTGEETYFQLMKLYDQMKSPQAVEFHYQALKQMLSKELDAEPSEEIQAWYKNWQKNSAVYLT